MGGLFGSIMSRADAGDVAALADDLPRELLRELITGGTTLPRPLWQAWFAGSASDGDGHVTMARHLPAAELADPHAPGSMCRALLDLAQPAVNAALYVRGDATLRRFIVSGAPDAARGACPRTDAGLVPIGPVPLDATLHARLLAPGVDMPELNSAVVAVAPEIVAHVLRAGRLTGAERVLGLLRLFDLGAHAELDRILRDSNWADTEPGGLVTAFLAGERGRDEVEAFVLAEARPEAYTRRLRGIDGSGDLRLDAPHTFAWPPIIAAHHESPLHAGVLAHLAVRHGWDAATRHALFGATSDGVPRAGADCFESRPNPVLDLLAAADDVDDLIASTAPVFDMLLIGGTFDRYLHRDFARVEEGLDRVVRRPLADDVEAWVRLGTLAPAFPGSLEQLVAAALDPDPDPDHRYPPLDRPPPTNRSGLPATSRVGRVLRVLLRGVSAHVVARVAARLPADAAAELYRAPAVADPSAAVCLADPGLDAVLFQRTMSPTLQAELLARGAPPLLEHLVRNAPPCPRRDGEEPAAPGTYRLLRGCAAAFALDRPHQAADLVRAALEAAHPYERTQPVDVPGLVAQALEAPKSGGEKLLRDALDAWEHQARGGALFAADADTDDLTWYRSAADPGWDAVAEAVRAGRLTSLRLLLRFAHHPDLPPALARAAAASPRVISTRLGASRPLALAALDSDSAAVARAGRFWLTDALANGVLEPVEVLTRGRPAQAALDALDSVHLDAAAQRQLDAAWDDLVGRHLAGNPGAWRLVAALCADFAGSLTELLTVSATLDR
ncbi:hypothetical protein OG216_01360 [Streptomycetaceae bacterium NBC_01309]